MAVLVPCHNMPHFPPKLKTNPNKHIRRTATGVMAGTHDPIPTRDVLTSLLNGIGRYTAVEEDEGAKQKRKQEKKEQKREEKRKLKAAARARQRELLNESAQGTADNFASTSTLPHKVIASSTGTGVFWRARPTIHIHDAQRTRSVSVSEPPSPHFASTPGTPGSTPGPSHSSSTSRTSSKRPHTPEDDELLVTESPTVTISAPPRKKRAAAKKGWKGWVEGSPPPSEKLINLDAVPVLQERRTRSGKNFDGVGLAKEGWV